jgi:hypothetical protein
LRGPECQKQIPENSLLEEHWYPWLLPVTYNDNDYAVEFYRNVFCWVSITWDRQCSTWKIDGAAPSEWGPDILLEDTPLFTQTTSPLAHRSPETTSESDIAVAETTTRLEGLGILSDENDNSKEPLDIVIPATDAADQEEEHIAELISNVPVPKAPITSRKALPICASMATMLAPSQIQSQSSLRRTGRETTQPILQFGQPAWTFCPRHNSSPSPPHRGGRRGNGPPSGGGNGPPDPNTPGGGGNGPPDPNDPDTADPNDRLRDRLQGDPPCHFDGGRENSEMFLVEWNIYLGLNYNVRIMTVALSRTLLFISYFKGGTMLEWVQHRMQWLNNQIAQGAAPNNEYLYAKTLASFRQTFTDTMKLTKARQNIHLLKMTLQDLDEHVAKFERLAREGGYNLEDQAVKYMFGRSLPPALFAAIISHERPQAWHEWVSVAEKQQQIYLGNHRPIIRTNRVPPRINGIGPSVTVHATVAATQMLWIPPLVLVLGEFPLKNVTPS